MTTLERFYKEHEKEVTVMAWLSVIPLFVDPWHPEKYGGEFRRVMFWEWAYKELWEIWTGIELALKRLRGEI